MTTRELIEFRRREIIALRRLIAEERTSPDMRRSFTACIRRAVGQIHALGGSVPRAQDRRPQT